MPKLAIIAIYYGQKYERTDPNCNKAEIMN